MNASRHATPSAAPHAAPGATGSASHATASARLTLGMANPRHGLTALTAELHYTSADPYAIAMTLNPGTAQPVPWLLSRDLLRDALTAPQGLGDVQAWPAGGTGQQPAVLHIELSTPSGHARLQAPARAIAAFLQRTYALVPAGRETESADFGTELADLLSQA